MFPVNPKAREIGGYDGGGWVGGQELYGPSQDEPIRDGC
jgi:hypothetical protein